MKLHFTKEEKERLVITYELIPSYFYSNNTPLKFDDINKLISFLNFTDYSCVVTTKRIEA